MLTIFEKFNIGFLTESWKRLCFQTWFSQELFHLFLYIEPDIKPTIKQGWKIWGFCDFFQIINWNFLNNSEFQQPPFARSIKVSLVMVWRLIISGFRIFFFRINELWYIALFVGSGSIKKLLLLVLVFIFSQYFFNRFCPVEKCRVISHCFIVIHLL